MTSFLHDDIEYIIPTVFKASMCDWALDLINNGTIYFTNIKQFIDDPDPERGDKNEGRHIIIRQDVRCTMEYSMPVYVWCCTLDTNLYRVLRTWPEKNCVLQILDTVKFAQRITLALKRKRRKRKIWPLYVGPVVYTKTAGGYEATDWADGVFQKDERYDGQQEFRFALTDLTGQKPKDHIILKIGSCHDIVRIALIANPGFP